MPLNGTKRSQKGEESGNDKKMRAVKSIQISDFGTSWQILVFQKNNILN
jgi:hypothetical protein